VGLNGRSWAGRTANRGVLAACELRTGGALRIRWDTPFHAVGDQ